MNSSNPYNFIDPLTLHIPVNKFCIPSVETLQTFETYFNGVTKKNKELWQYDNYFSTNIVFDIKQKRGDRHNIDYYCEKIHEEVCLLLNYNFIVDNNILFCRRKIKLFQVVHNHGMDIVKIFMQNQIFMVEQIHLRVFIVRQACLGQNKCVRTHLIIK